MAIPSGGANLVGTHTLAITDLGLSASITSAADDDSTVIHTCVPAKVIVISKLTSGSGTIKAKVAATSGAVTYGSPTGSLSASGTSQQVLTFATDADNLYCGIQLSSASTAEWNDLDVFVLYDVLPGLESSSIKHAINTIANNTWSDGSGDFDFDFA